MCVQGGGWGAETGFGRGEGVTWNLILPKQQHQMHMFLQHVCCCHARTKVSHSVSTNNHPLAGHTSGTTPRYLTAVAHVECSFYNVRPRVPSQTAAGCLLAPAVEIKLPT